MKRYNLALDSLGIIFAALLFYRLLGVTLRDNIRFILLVLVAGIAVVLLYCLQKDFRMRRLTTPKGVSGAISELALLNEEDEIIRIWTICDKASLTIGKSTLDSHADIDLRGTAFAGMIDLQHALLNYTPSGWFVEDNESRNGLSVQKKDGKRYYLSKTEPCLLEKNDVLFVANTKLLLR